MEDNDALLRLSGEENDYTSSESEESIDVEEVEEGSNREKKNRYKTGYSLFYANVAAEIVKDAAQQKQIAPTITELSKCASKKWKRLDKTAREDWNRKAQVENEERDCGRKEESKCSVCGRLFSKAKYARHHERSCGNWTCTDCGKVFNDTKSLRAHKKVHETTYKCDVCGKSFGILRSWARHTDTHSKPTLECQICGRKFSNKQNLKRHLKNIHKI